MATVVKDLGAVTAYAYAVAGGYSGTEAEFEALLGNIAEDLSEIENLSVTVTTLPAGSSATASYNNGVLSLGIPKGDKGDKGDTGATGATGPQGIPGDVANLASAYSTSSTYGVGDYCIYNSQLYRCTTPITTAETWTAAHWTAAVLGDDVGELKSASQLEANGNLYSEYGKSLVPATFKNGTWVGSAFSDADVYNYRVGMPNYVVFDRNITLTALTGYTMRVTYFNDDGTWKSTAADSVQTYTVPLNTKFAITIKNTANETTKAKADITTYVSAVTFDSYASYRADNVGADIIEVDSKIGQITAKLTKVKSANLLDESALSVGYVQSDGSYHTDVTSYKYTELFSVNPGDVLSFWVQSGSAISTTNARFTCAYDSDGNAVSASGSNSNIASYTVPNGISYVRFSFATSVLALDCLMVIKGSTKPLTYEKYFTPYYKTSDAFGFGVQNVYRKRQADLSTAITFPSTNVVKNVVYAFTAAIASMGTITIGQGEPTDYFMSSVTIDDTNVTITVNGSEYPQAHNLTVADYINVKIMVNDNTKATVMVESNGGVYTRTLGWYGDSTKDYYCKQTGAVLSDVSFSVTFTDSGCDTYIFGDSYIAVLESTSKWSHYLIADGFGDNVLINALPGENGADAYNALINLLKLGRPKRIIWCLGMNDGTDTGDTPNDDWMNRIQNFLIVCNNNGITPILSTIPTVPSINHEAKNAWVRSSGYRYIDFAKAVGASSNGVWYTGMLSSDNVHPTELGAKRLYSQVLCDAQEVTLR